MKSFTRKGFTLVEMLIVIMVIGILASMMMISGTESISTASANNVITGLRNLAIATMSYYTDNKPEFAADPSSVVDKTTEVLKYLNSFNESADYRVKWDTEGSLWVGYCIKNDDKNLKSRLKGRAEGENLKQNNDSEIPPSASSKPAAYNDKKYVWLLVRKK